MSPTDVTPPNAEAPSKVTNETIALVEESVVIAKHRSVTGSVQVRTLTETFEENVEAELATTGVVVERIPIDRIVEAAPQTRVENGVTIVPVFEEVLVLERRIRLVEELHIRPETTNETVRLPVTVRRQRAVVERLPVVASHTPSHKGTTPSPL